MLVRVEIENYRSFKDRQEFSMVASRRGDRDDLVHVESANLDLVRVSGVFGPNASGKSNLLKAINFIREAVLHSHTQWSPSGGIDRDAFAFREAESSPPTSFEIDFVQKDVLYSYGFSCDSERILTEWLDAYPKRRRQSWFARDVNSEEEFWFGTRIKGQVRAISEMTRPNSLFLSTAASNNHEALRQVYDWFAKTLICAGEGCGEHGLGRTLFHLSSDLKKPDIIEFLTTADLGIVDVDVSDEPIEEELAEAFGVFMRALGGEEESKRTPRLRKVDLRHRAGLSREGVGIPLDEESLGTKRWLELAGFVLEGVKAGKVLCVDELDRSLHPRLSAHIIQAFQSSSSSAQLIFNSHDTSLMGNMLDDRVLKRDQIWFADRGTDGSTELSSLVEFKARRDENVERGYHQGRYGAVPHPVRFSPTGESDE